MPTAMRPARAAMSSNETYGALFTSGSPLASSLSVATTPEPPESWRPDALVTRPRDVMRFTTSAYDTALPVAASIQYVVCTEHDHASYWMDAGVSASKRESSLSLVVAAFSSCEGAHPATQ